jgi:hypothetical protein
MKWQGKVVFLLVAFVVFEGCVHNPSVPKAPSPNPPSAVVFDIDGTLTPSPAAFLEARPDAVEAVRLYSQKGYKVFYLSARPIAFQKKTIEWLKKNGFPDYSSIYLAERMDEHPDVFKMRMLEEFRTNGWKLAYAYGDSNTDFIAYEKVEGLIYFALRPEEKHPCVGNERKVCLSGWSEHFSFIKGRERQPTTGEQK